MDSQRPFLYITLVFLGFMLWTSWIEFTTPKPPAATQNAAAQTQTAGHQNVTNSANANSTEIPTQQNNNLINAGAHQGANGSGQVAGLITVKTDTLHLKINTRGGEIIEADLPTYPISLEQQDEPVRILDLNGRNYVAQSGLLHQQITGLDTQGLAPSHQAEYQAAQQEYTLEAGQDELVVPLVWQQNGITVTKRFVFKRGQFAVAVQHEVKNSTDQLWSGSQYRQLKHGLHAGSGSFLTGNIAYVGGAYYYDDQYTRIGFEEMEEDKISLSTTGGWIGVLEHYFLSAWVPNQQEQGNYYSMGASNLGVKSYILGMRGNVQQIAPGATHIFDTIFYVGPKDQDSLEAIAAGLDLTVDYGIFAFISKPIFWVMQSIHSIVGNWGWTIIFLTLLIKLIFFWPSAASYKSMAKMKAVAPKLKEINERFASDPQAKQKALMDIYKKEKINPLGGCLPILIQIPVFMGLYWVLLESVELRQAPWMLWYEDLSIMDPFFVLPLIMGASMYFQQKLNPPQVDPMQQRIFQLMPIIFTFMFLWFPAGLVLYWVVNNILSIAQQWYINKKIVGHA